MLTAGFRLACVLCGTLFAVACASQQHSRIDSKVIERSASDLAGAIEAQAMNCWQEEPTFLTNGIMVKSHQSIQRSSVITASNWSAGRGPQLPFLIIEITANSEGGSQVSVSGVQSSTTQPFIDDVTRWADGQVGCR